MTVAIAENIADGYHPDLPRSVYDCIPALNYSVAKRGLRSMAHLWHGKQNPPEQTPAMRLGNAQHLATFEPGEFAASVVMAKKFDRRTTAGKAEFASFEAANSDKIVLDVEDFVAVKGMSDSLRQHPDAAAFLALPAHTEVTCVWTDDATGVRCKCRIDRYAHGHALAADLKTTINASLSAWPKAVAQYLYHLQAAWYLEGIRKTRGEEASWLWMAVENEAPYCCAVYECGPQTLDQGAREMRSIINNYAECVKTGIWPGYPSSAILTVDLPVWASDGQ